MNIDDTTSRIILGLAALIAAGAFIAIRIKKKNSNNKTVTNQNNNKVSNGDIVGGNKTTNSK